MSYKECLVVSWDKEKNVYGMLLKTVRGSCKPVRHYCELDQSMDFASKLFFVNKKIRHTDSCLVVLSGNIPKSTVIEISVPRVPLNDLSQLISFEISQNIPFPVDSVKWCYRVIPDADFKDNSKYRVRIFAVLSTVWDELLNEIGFSTLHTNDAAGTISRLLDMGLEGFLLSSALRGVLSQRLVRECCNVCHGEGVYAVNSKCKNCSGSGFKGRTAIFELMTVDSEIREAISQNSDSIKIAEIAKKNGMKTLVEDGQRKINEGLTTDVEIARIINDS